MIETVKTPAAPIPVMILPTMKLAKECAKLVRRAPKPNIIALALIQFLGLKS
jgi:hypothetical protein